MQPTLQQWLDRKPAGRKPRKPVKKRSAKRQRDAKEYTKLRAAFLIARPRCQACGPFDDAFGAGATWDRHKCAKSCDVHHKAGRLGGNLLNTTTWMAVCRSCHDWIHAHPSDARKLGLLK